MAFHCYISICLYKTTLEFLRGEAIMNQVREEIEEYNPKKNKDKATSEENKMDTQKTIVV